MAIVRFENLDPNDLPVIGESVPIHVYARTRKGDWYDLSGTTKIYCTLKSDLTVLDASASLQINSSSNPSSFDLTKAASGEIIVTLPHTSTAGLTAGTLYYMDIKAIWGSLQKYIVRNSEMRFAQWVTRSTS